MGKVIPRDVWQLVGTPEKGVDEDNRYTTDPKTILLALAVRSAVASISPDAPDYFELLRDAYAQVCAPHRIVGPVNDEVGNLDVLFSDGQCDYRYDGLSSGEQMVLLFLLRFVSEHIHRSIVLIDEIELHQHPLWQRKLVNMLPAMGEGNQFILTTHSSYLRDLAPKESTMSLGELGDSAQ
jgi:predicted ATPase